MTYRPRPFRNITQCAPVLSQCQDEAVHKIYIVSVFSGFEDMVEEMPTFLWVM